MPLPSARPIAATAMLIALCGCYSDEDEIEAESAAILARAPVGTSFIDLPGAMGTLGFSCTPGRKRFVDAKGNVREAESHLSCERDQRFWLVCRKRTRAILLQLNGRLSNILVNVGHFCA